jgi:hypothetical protein
LIVAEEHDCQKQPFLVAYYGHGYIASSLEVLGSRAPGSPRHAFGANATFRLEMGETSCSSRATCSRARVKVRQRAAHGRARAIWTTGTKDSGGDY